MKKKTMRKLSLNLDDLQVESFATTDLADSQASKANGYGLKTVIGPTGNLSGCETSAYSCAGTCLFQQTCGAICITG